MGGLVRTQHVCTYIRTYIHAYTGLFRGLGAVAVLDLTLAKELSAIETCAHAESVFRSQQTAGRVGGKGRGAKQAPLPQKYPLYKRTQENTFYIVRVHILYVSSAKQTRRPCGFLFFLRRSVSGSFDKRELRISISGSLFWRLRVRAGSATPRSASTRPSRSFRLLKAPSRSPVCGCERERERVSV